MPTANFTHSTNDTNIGGTVAVTYTEQVTYPRLALTGAQTYALDLAMMPAAGLRALEIVYSATDGAGVASSAVVTVRRVSNSVTKDEELSPGGMLSIVDPSPVNGITAVSIITTADALLKIGAWG